jgi:hypothetical protein
MGPVPWPAHNDEEETVSYLVFCTFDLKGASQQDYQNAYAELAKRRKAKANQ